VHAAILNFVVGAYLGAKRYLHQIWCVGTKLGVLIDTCKWLKSTSDQIQDGPNTGQNG